MLIAALAAYYDSLRREGAKDLPPEGFTVLKVRNLVVLSEDGRIADILPNTRKKIIITKKNEEKEYDEPLRELYPERIETTKICANLLDHRGAYLFGVSFKKNGDELQAVPETKKHQAFLQENLEFFRGLKCAQAQAFVRFMENWDPASQENIDLLRRVYAPSAYYCFCLEDDMRKFHKVPDIRDALLEIIRERDREEALQAPQGQCAVSGQQDKLALLHRNLKGIQNAQPSGTNIVSVNMEAAESFQVKGGLNSPVTRTVMKKYTAAFNYLTQKPNHMLMLGGLSVLLFSQTAVQDNQKCDMIGGFDNFEYLDESDPRTNQINTMLKQMRSGFQPDFSAFVINEKEPFYLFGFTPNQARLSVRFVYRNSFGKIAENFLRHFIDLEWVPEKGPIGIGRLVNALTSSTTKDAEVSSSLKSDLFRAVVSGTMYPRELLTEAVYRARTDCALPAGVKESERRLKAALLRNVNEIRVAIIHAYLCRKARLIDKKEDFIMNIKETKTPAYLCGRAFAVLEKAQSDALEDGNKTLNATIKDRYFSAAVTRPATVMPKLIMLAQHHFGKSTDNESKKRFLAYDERLLEEILGDLPEFPSTITLETEGEFILGYYHQKKELYRKKEKEDGSN